LSRFVVSVGSWRHADRLDPPSGCSRSKRSRIAASTGICRSAHSIRRTPSGASARSLTSCLVVVAIVPLSVVVSGYEKLFVLALLPGNPVGLARSLGRDGRTVQPGFDRGPQLRVAPQPDDERHVVELDVVAPPQLGEPAEELQGGVAPSAWRRPGGPPRWVAPARRYPGASPPGPTARGVSG